MDSRYFRLVRQAQEVAALCNDLAMNANHRPDVDASTQKYLEEYEEAIGHARSLMFLAVSRQMAHDPQERDIDISHAIHHNH